MTMGVKWDNRDVFHRSMFLMRVLLSLFPLVFVIWNGEALPIQDKQSQTNEILSKEEDGLKMITYVAELNLTSKELADLDAELLNGKLWEKSDKPSKDKSPCKLFFWKTFSSC
ncbi:somatostatin 6 precursor [Danio rerio]|uniref:Somatostatin 6 n=2 Tax=Danio rerio TaxID=7955 RepID=F1QY50_DANRE|nr:somatostatin 6 [Danio rerio]|eukprot:NP_001122256.2 somatostatin 6 [Danio rerio]